MDKLISETPKYTAKSEVSANKQEHTVSELVDRVNKKLEDMGTHIQVKIHDKTNTIMIMVIEDESNEIIREIPSEKMLDIMYNLSQNVGLFLDEKI